MKLKLYNIRGLVYICLLILMLAIPAFSQWSLQLSVPHRSQQENWSCGPNTIAMWAGYIRRQSMSIYPIADKYCGRDGTTIPEFMNAMFRSTSYGYVFSEWAYENKYTAIKGVMYSIARFSEPVAIAGNGGGHYYLIVGGGATKNPYTYYGTRSNIQYLYVHDSRENSPLYDTWSTRPFLSYPILRKGQRYTPAQVMANWTKIGAWGDKKYRSVERNTHAAWGSQGATYYNRDNFSSY